MPVDSPARVPEDCSASRRLALLLTDKYVHSLHHRNADPEPFSGMTMHPIEHLYYFSNALTPVIYMRLSPLIFLWNYIHLTIAPGAGHSGFEDHFQADQYHYIHHQKFECERSPLMCPPANHTQAVHAGA